MPAGDALYKFVLDVLPPHGYKSALWIYPRGPASIAPNEGPRLAPVNASQNYGAAYAGSAARGSQLSFRIRIVFSRRQLCSTRCPAGSQILRDFPLPCSYPKAVAALLSYPDPRWPTPSSLPERSFPCRPFRCTANNRPWRRGPSHATPLIRKHAVPWNTKPPALPDLAVRAAFSGPAPKVDAPLPAASSTPVVLALSSAIPEDR